LKAKIAKQSIMDQDHRGLTVGILIMTTVVAFETLAVTTIAPTIAKDLQGLALYGWIFSIYLLTQIIGTVFAGQQVDRYGPRSPFLIALILFLLGILIDAIAPNIYIFLIGRTIQGFGAGGLLNSVYASITIHYDDEFRPRMLAIVASAYIVPAMIGPYGAGLVAEHFTWRIVFFALIPLLMIAALLMVVTFRNRHSPAKPANSHSRLLAATQLAVSACLLQAGLNMVPDSVGLLLVILGLGLIIVPLQKLLPKGIFLARTPLSASLAARSLFTATYFGEETFLVLGLTLVQNYPAETAGLVVALAAITWTISSWLQAYLDRRDGGQKRKSRMTIGVVFMFLALCILQGIVWMPRPVALICALAGHTLSGLGIGLAEPTSGTIIFASSPVGEEGTVSSSLQLADLITPAISIGIGGAFISISTTIGWGTSFGVAAALGLHLFLIALSLGTCWRLLHVQ
jgi:MFS family permease